MSQETILDYWSTVETSARIADASVDPEATLSKPNLKNWQGAVHHTAAHISDSDIPSHIATQHVATHPTE